MSVGSSLPVVELDSINTTVQFGMTRSVHSAAEGTIFYIMVFEQSFIFCCLRYSLMNAATVTGLHGPIFGPTRSHWVWPVAFSEKSSPVWPDRLQLGLARLRPSQPT